LGKPSKLGQLRFAKDLLEIAKNDAILQSRVLFKSGAQKLGQLAAVFGGE
jgi:hypothetical protein